MRSFKFYQESNKQKRSFQIIFQRQFCSIKSPYHFNRLNGSLSLFIFLFFCQLTLVAQDVILKKEAEHSLHKAISFFETVNHHGGYVYAVSTDLKMWWGEGQKDAETIEVQPPGTPAVGQSFLLAYQVTRDSTALEAAKKAAYALIAGQNIYGGWDHTIDFKNLQNNMVSFDDNQSQSAISFLMALNQEIKDEPLKKAVNKALEMMVNTQLANGGWPHIYPEQGNYHDFATFNDGGINDCIRVLIEAFEYDKNNKAILKSLQKAARFLVISQLPPPQPGWAQQYNEFLQPAWARTFEPASVCPAVTIRNIHTLLDLYKALGDPTLLEPIPDALRWLQEIRLENGKWARFVEIGTNKSLYYDRGRIRVDKIEDLHPERRTGYAYETNLESDLEKGKKRYELATELKSGEFKKIEKPDLSKTEIINQINALSEKIKKVISDQSPIGAWVTKDDIFKEEMPRGVRWNGQYIKMDRIKSEVFNHNVAMLCRYIDLYKQLRIEK